MSIYSIETEVWKNDKNSKRYFSLLSLKFFRVSNFRKIIRERSDLDDAIFTNIIDSIIVKFDVNQISGVFSRLERSTFLRNYR